MATREEMIEYRVSTKGETAEVAATKVDNHLRATGREKEITGAVAKPTPKATPAAKAPPKPPAAKAPETPKPSPAVAAQVPEVGAKVYGAEAPDRIRDYSDTAPPMTRSRAAEIMPKPDMELIGIKRGGEGVYAPRAPAAPTGAARYAYVADMRREDSNAGVVGANAATAAMRAAVKAKMPPAAAAEIDAMGAEDLADAYGRIVAR